MAAPELIFICFCRSFVLGGIVWSGSKAGDVARYPENPGFLMNAEAVSRSAEDAATRVLCRSFYRRSGMTKSIETSAEDQVDRHVLLPVAVKVAQAIKCAP
jgi:hypothetical protein